jgi:hypothetical protein
MITYHINVMLSDRHSEQERRKPVILFMIGARDFSLFQGPNFGNHINSLSLFLSLSLSPIQQVSRVLAPGVQFAAI